VVHNRNGTVTWHAYDVRWIWLPFVGWVARSQTYLGSHTFDPDEEDEVLAAEKWRRGLSAMAAVNEAANGLAAGVIVGSMFIPGPEDVFVAWLALKGLKLVDGHIVSKITGRIVDNEAEIVGKYLKLRTKSGSPIWKGGKPGKGRYKKSPDGKEWWDWDNSHGGEIECYNKRGEHTGVRDPVTGKIIKPAEPGRRIDL
jgi:hypothetical protein